MTYFKDCKTIVEVKTKYKLLAKQFHPDLGGDTATMQAINSEYAYACARILNEANLSPEENDEGIRLSEQYRVVIELLMPIAGILIEVIGAWIWVTGDTKPVKQQLKEAGLFYASKKVAWYYRAVEFKTTGSKKSLDEIRAKYGSETVTPRQQHRSINQHY